MTRLATLSACVVGAVLCLVASIASGQATEEPSRPAPARTEGTVFLPPLGQLSGSPDYHRILGPFGPVFNPSEPHSPFNLTPTLSVQEEFNDNVFLNNQNRRADFITSFTPGLTLSLLNPVYRLTASYDISAELYALNSSLSNIGNRQNFLADASYDFSPALTLSLNDRFSKTYNSPQATDQGVSTGRTQAMTNSIAPGVSYKLTAVDTLRAVGGYTFTRIDRGQQQQQQQQQQPQQQQSSDSDIYQIDSSLDHTFTARYTGTLGYQIQRIDFTGQPSSIVHSPRIGGTYQVRATTTASSSGGLSIRTSAGATTVSPAGTATLTEQFKFGSASLTYNRSVSPVGTLAQISDTQTIGGAVLVTSLMRGLTLTVAPRYTKTDSSNFKSTTLTGDIAVSYQISPWISVFGSYTLLRQQSSGGGTANIDMDQNRVSFGLQTRYPIDLY